jgi:hypothetical protein
MIGPMVNTPSSGASEATTQTVNFDNSMTTAEIQALIDAIPKYLPVGVEVTFQFADGTYTSTGTIIFEGFYGGGSAYVYGNSSDNTLSNSKSVVVDVVTASTYGFRFRNNSCTFRAYYIRVNVADGQRAFQGNDCINLTFQYNHVQGNGKTSSTGSAYHVSKVLSWEVRNCGITNIYYGIFSSSNSSTYSFNNDDFTTSPVYGLISSAATIYRVGTQPAGSTANELTVSGGQIFS